MKRSIAIGLTLFGFSLADSTLAAGLDYAGAKAGVINRDVRGFDGVLNVGALAGFTIAGNSIASFAVEGELTTTLVDGDAPRNQEWDTETLGVFGTVRAGNTAYLKLKAGLVYTHATVGVGNDSDIDFGLGFGGGWRSGERAMLEIEYTQIADHVDFISIGYVSKF